jgi:multiple sugar transport system substrate-binding protein
MTPSRSRRVKPPRRLAIALMVGLAMVGAGLVVRFFKDKDSSEKIVRQEWAVNAPSGPVRFCSGDDVTGGQRRTERDYNRRFPGSTATFDEASFIADSQHDLYLKLIEDGKDDCDVIYLDVIYMAEFAANGLLYDMSPYLTPARQADFDDQMIESAKHDGELWGVPKQRDVGVLYYRSDLVHRPRSWQDVYRQARRRRPQEKPGLRLPVGTYEGLTVMLLELAYAAGAPPIISANGETVHIDEPQVLDALRFMRNAVRDGVIPDVEQQTDTGNLGVYELGRASFLRGWPFVASRLREDVRKGRDLSARRARQAAADNTKIVPLPPWGPRGESVAILGGHLLVIPRSAKNPSAALRLIDFMTSDGQVRKDEREDSQYPVLKVVANDLELRHRTLIDAIEDTTAIARPTIPEYADVSTIISAGVKKVLDGPADDQVLRDTLDQIERDVQEVLD